MTIFVIMPFGEYFDEYYEVIYKKAIEEVGCVSIRSDEIYKSQPVIEKIFNLIINSDCLIADLSGKNPNVSYELGIAHTLGKPVILTSSNIDDIPFDYRHLQVLVYNTKRANWQLKLIEKIQNSIKSIRENKNENILKIELLEKRQKILNTFLTNSHIYFSAEINKISNYNIDAFGNATLHQTWKVTPKTDITHLLYSPYIDKPGQIKIKKAFDLNIRENIEVFVVSEKKQTTEFAFLFNNLKPSNKTFTFEIEVYLENFLSDLFDKGFGQVFHTNKRDSKISYKDSEINLIFRRREDLIITAEYEVLNELYSRKIEITPVIQNDAIKFNFTSTDIDLIDNETIITLKLQQL